MNVPWIYAEGNKEKGTEVKEYKKKIPGSLSSKIQTSILRGHLVSLTQNNQCRTPDIFSNWSKGWLPASTWEQASILTLTLNQNMLILMIKFCITAKMGMSMIKNKHNYMANKFQQHYSHH